MSVLAMDLRNIADDAFYAEVERRARERPMPPDTAKHVLQTMPKDLVIREANGRIGSQIIRTPEEININALSEAAARFARRDYPETLWNLEKALGRKFSGLGDLVLGKH